MRVVAFMLGPDASSVVELPRGALAGLSAAELAAGLLPKGATVHRSPDVSLACVPRLTGLLALVVRCRRSPPAACCAISLASARTDSKGSMGHEFLVLNWCSVGLSMKCKTLTLACLLF